MENLPEKIIISDDLGHLPPPFCYKYRVEIYFATEPDVNIAIEYYGRDELDPAEIEAEGFSENDDFEWTGKLPETWSRAMASAFQKTTAGTNKKGPKIQSWQNGKSRDLKPLDPKQFEYFVQELIQAIYENAGKQEKLTIRAVNIAKQVKPPERYELEVSFYDRKAVLAFQNNFIDLSWEKTQKTIEQLFQYDFDPFNISQKEPKKEGLYLDTGDGYWYKAGVGIKTIDGKNPQEKILALLKNLT